MKTTERLACFVLETSYGSFSPPVIHQAKRCFLDLLGVALGGSIQPLTKILVKTVRGLGGNPQATVWGHRLQTSTLNAALINGAMAHALDFDDTHIGSIIHPSAPVIPAVLAVAEWKRLSGKAAIEAFVLGFEAEIRIGLGMGHKHYDRGWHSTSTCGRFGAAAAVGKLIGLSREEMMQAIGLAGTQAAGLRLVFGTMTKPFHPGKSAFDGMLAAILAKEGFTCAPNLLEAKKGFVEVLGVDSNAETIGKNLGRPFQVMKNTFKPYAACLLTHPTIDGVIRLRDQYHLQPAGVAAIECEVARFCMDSAGQMEPKTGLAGKFSLPFCAALALAEGAAGEDLFTDRRVRDPRMIALRKKVKAKVVPALKDTEAKVTITTKEGRKYAIFIDRPKGDPRNPPTDEELEAKFRMLAGFALSPSAIDSLADRVWNLEKLKDVRGVIELMKGAKAGKTV